MLTALSLCSSPSIPPTRQGPRPGRSRLAPLAARRRDDRSGNGGGSSSDEEHVDYSRPKALKEPLATTASGPRSSSSSSSSQQQPPPGELEVVLETLRLLFCKAIVDPLVRPAHIGACESACMHGCTGTGRREEARHSALKAGIIMLSDGPPAPPLLTPNATINTQRTTPC